MTEELEDDGWEFVNEVERARSEAPDFPEVLACKRAIARGEAYTPEKHGPFEHKIIPRMARISETQPMIDVDALMARFMAKGASKVRDYKQAAGGDS